MAPRGYCGGPNFYSTDFSVDKNWKVHELVTVQFRLDFFNLLNHANFNPSSGSFTAFASVNCGSEIGVDSCERQSPVQPMQREQQCHHTSNLN